MPNDCGNADQNDTSTWKILKVMACGMCYIALSASLINFNKFLMTPGRFPFAACMVLFHMVASTLFAGTLYVVKPSFFPALTHPENRITVDKRLFLKGVLPVALFFAGTLVLSNLAYLYGSVAFLQMVKEGNVVIVYLFSLIVGLETFNSRNFVVLLAIVLATSMTITGEIRFSMAALVIQLSSMLFECSKIILQALLLSPSRQKLDPMTYTLLVSPVCFVILGACLLGLSDHFPGNAFTFPSLQVLQSLWPYLIANCCIAVLLNIVAAIFIQLAQGVAYALTGIMKDAMIVIASVIFVHEVISFQQGVGFALQLAFIFLWSMLKTFPNTFKDGVARTLCRMITRRSSTQETNSLLKGMKEKDSVA